jgi:DNA-binding transcriptional LysR family regulator
VRIAAFSSVLRSVIIPALAPFLRKHSKVQIEFRSYEMVQLESVLQRGEADFVVTDYRMKKNQVEEHLLGKEEYVVIESSKHPSPEDIYLDHGPQDNATESYFAAQKMAPKHYRRTFMGDVYGIIDGVQEGLGRAVMSKHLIKGQKNLKIIKGYKPYFREIVLHSYKQSYTPKLQQLVIQELEKSCPETLKSS